jgi:hypothetical protein
VQLKTEDVIIYIRILRVMFISHFLKIQGTLTYVKERDHQRETISRECAGKKTGWYSTGNDIKDIGSSSFPCLLTFFKGGHLVAVTQEESTLIYNENVNEDKKHRFCHIQKPSIEKLSKTFITPTSLDSNLSLSTHFMKRNGDMYSTYGTISNELDHSTTFTGAYHSRTTQVAIDQRRLGVDRFFVD